MVRQDRFVAEDFVAVRSHPVVPPMLYLMVWVDDAGRTMRRTRFHDQGPDHLEQLR